jgi:hypothetical protein
MEKFNCDQCGLCCTKLSNNDLYKELDRGDGTCRFLNCETMLCKIYENRPLICNIDLAYEKFFKEKMSLEEYYLLNKKHCQQFQNKKKVDLNG